MNTNTAAAIATLTAKGADTMTAVGQGRLSFFDDGVVEGSGTWGTCIVPEMGHKSSGVINQLVKVGMFTGGIIDGDDAWYELTALGADVALVLAANAGRTEAPSVDAKPSLRTDLAKLTRNECITALRAAGYDGPVSYLVPVLRELVAQHA